MLLEASLRCVPFCFQKPIFVILNVYTMSLHKLFTMLLLTGRLSLQTLYCVAHFYFLPASHATMVISKPNKPPAATPTSHHGMPRIISATAANEKVTSRVMIDITSINPSVQKTPKKTLVNRNIRM